MLPPEISITTNHIIAVLLVPAAATLFDWILRNLFDRKVFEPIWSGAKRRYKSWRTKHNKITADYEFSIYLDSNLPEDAPREVTDDLLESVRSKSSGDFEIREEKWSNDDHEVDVTVLYKNRADPFELTLNFVPDPDRMNVQSSDTGFNPSIGSIGVSTTFRFEFGNLRSSIIDLMLFARFFREAAKELLSVRSMTDGRFVVSPIESDLTLDDWIKKEQFDVSLLLESEDRRNSVEFYSDRAVISSPHTDVDDKTVEYIRATLLNYYL